MSNEQKQPHEGKPLTAEHYADKHYVTIKGENFVSIGDFIASLKDYAAQQTAAFRDELENAKGAMDAYYEIADLLRVPEAGSVIEAVEGLKTTLDETYAGALADNEELEKVKEELERWKSKYEFSVEAGKVISDELEKWKDSTKDLADQKGKLLKELEAVKKERNETIGKYKAHFEQQGETIGKRNLQIADLNDEILKVTRQRDEAVKMVEYAQTVMPYIGCGQYVEQWHKDAVQFLSRLSSGEI